MRRLSFYKILVLVLSIALIHTSHGTVAAYELFAVGDVGTSFHNDGDEWRRISGVLSGNTNRFWAFSEDNLYAIASPSVFHYDGASWDKFYTSPEGVTLRVIWCSSETDMFVSGLSQTGEVVLLHYDGVDWTDTRYPASSYLSVRYISGSSASDVYVITRAEFLHFDGIDLSEVDLGVWGDEDLYWSGLWCNASDDVYLLGYYKYNAHTFLILHYNGSAWNEIFTQDTIDLTSLWVSDEGSLYAAGHIPYYPMQGLVVRYSDSWQIDTIPDVTRLYSVHGISSNDVYVVGEAPTYPDSGIVCHFDGNGWSVAPQLTEKVLSSVCAVTENFILASAYGGYVYQGSGADWNRWLPDITINFRDVWGTSLDNLYAVDDEGSIHRYDGISWSAFPGPGYSVTKIWGLSENEIYTVGSDGVFLYDGIDWSQIYTETANDIWGRSSTDIYATVNISSTRSYVYHFDGSEWSSVLGSFGGCSYPIDCSSYFTGVWGTPEGELFVVGHDHMSDFENQKAWDQPRACYWNGSQWETLYAGGKWFYDYYMSDVWGSSGDHVFMTGTYDTRMFDGETVTELGRGETTGNSVWSSGNEAWWTHNDYSEGYLFHYNGFEASQIYLNGMDLYGVWGIGASYKVAATVMAEPEGPEFMVDGTPYTEQYVFLADVGTTHEIGVESPQVVGEVEYQFLGWSDGGDTIHTIVVPDTNVTYTAHFCRRVDVTVTTDPPGLDVTVAVTTYSSPYFFSILSGTELEIGTLSPQWQEGTVYYFDEWSDGGDTTHMVTLPVTDIVYTATFADYITGDEPIPLVNALHQNYPNPFNPSTTIRFNLESGGHALLAVYDVAGRLVRMLIDDVAEAGPHDVTWDGKDNAGRGIASGVYFYRLQAGEFTETRKMVLLR